MTEEPYRWLEAINNRREYIRDQLKGGTPVFAVSCPEGIVMAAVGQGQSKVFEIYDRHAYAALGHPVDIEKLRQSAIEAAHMEGFNRSSQDVTLRRLVSFALSPILKNSFEQIHSPPLMVESIFAEVGPTPDSDVIVRINYDGHHHYETSGVCVAFTDSKLESACAEWIRNQLKGQGGVSRVVETCLAAWQALVTGKPLADIQPPNPPIRKIEGRKIEVGFLDRTQSGPVQYKTVQL